MFDIPIGARHIVIEENETSPHIIGECASLHASHVETLAVQSWFVNYRLQVKVLGLELNTLTPICRLLTFKGQRVRSDKYRHSSYSHFL